MPLPPPSTYARPWGYPWRPPSRLALGKPQRVLLGAGFDPRTVVAAMVTAIQTGWHGSAESIAQEMVVAAAGHRRTRHDFQQALAETSARIEQGESLVWQTMRAEMARREELTP